jgi:hypothetical protein
MAENAERPQLRYLALWRQKRLTAESLSNPRSGIISACRGFESLLRHLVQSAGSRVSLGHQQSAQNDHAPITHREDVDPAGHWTAGRPRRHARAAESVPTYRGPSSSRR